MSKILLGSQSPGRKHVLEKFGLLFDSLAPHIDEKSNQGPITFSESIDLVLLNSRLKMNKLQQLINFDDYILLITSDTTVFCNNRIYEKTYDKQEAVKLLSELIGKTHQVITGVTMIIRNNTEDTTPIELYEVTEVTITSDQTLIDFYLRSDDCLGKAGCYGVQGSGSIIIDEIKGNLDNVIGLPINKIIKKLSTNILSLLKNVS